MGLREGSNALIDPTSFIIGLASVVSSAASLRIAAAVCAQRSLDRTRPTMKIEPSQLPALARSYPGMLTEGDRAMYFQTARDLYTFSGTVVDLGTFFGATTTCLALGMINNPRLSHELTSRLRVDVYTEGGQICSTAKETLFRKRSVPEHPPISPPADFATPWARSTTRSTTYRVDIGY